MMRNDIMTNQKKDLKTEELETILGNTHIENVIDYLCDNGKSLIDEDHEFFRYFKERLSYKGIKQQEVFLLADIPEGYGYKLLNGEKHTKQRDILIRLCYAAGFTVNETQKALKLYRMPELYAKIPRDALIMIAFNERPGSIIDVNGFLKKNKMEPLRSSGIQD